MQRLHNLKEKLYGKWVKKSTPKLAKLRLKRIQNRDFSIICNNCWGGYVYRRYGLPYASPTVGLYFFAEEYLKFCNNLKLYLETPLTFIRWQDSKYSTALEGKNQTACPIGKLGDVEIVFLHFKTEEEAKDKWERRSARVNFNNLIYKFSQMNLCTMEHLKAFDALDVTKKFVFVSGKQKSIRSAIRVSSEDEISDDTTFYDSYINIKRLINCKECCGKPGKIRGKL